MGVLCFLIHKYNPVKQNTNGTESEAEPSNYEVIIMLQSHCSIETFQTETGKLVEH